MQPTARAILLTACCALVARCVPASRSTGFEYPEAEQGDVVDDYFGTLVPDPYRWLEDPDSEQTLAWVEAENALTYGYLRDETWDLIHGRLTQLWDHPRWSVPVREGDRMFFSYNDGLMDQPVWYVEDVGGGEPRVLIDPNALSDDGTVAVTEVVPSRDGRLVAYLVSTGGSDRQQIRILDVDAMTTRDEVLDDLKFTSVAWLPDSSGFIYNRYPTPGSVAESDLNRYNRVYAHVLGTSQAEDVLVYERPDDPDLGFAPWITEDGRYLLLYVYRGTDPKNGVLIREVSSEGPFVHLTGAREAMYNPLGTVGDTLYVHTDLDAPRGRIVAMDLRDAGSEVWTEVVPERDDVIDSALLAGGRLVIVYMRHASNVMSVFDLDGGNERDVELPGLGSLAGVEGRQESQELYFGFTSFLHPTTIMSADVASCATSVIHAPELDFDASRYETVQVFYPSKDGTMVPMFVTRARDTEMDGTNPTLLYGYGGFNISLTPRFRSHYLFWLENGGVLAVANLRGGNEYGEEWHQAGILENKQNVFDDFVAAAGWLVSEGYTTSSSLAIMGGSNGGLLTAACMVQHPELFGAVVSAVPVIDMLRYQKFSVGHFWVSDYGNAEESAEQFEFLHAYSPLHNIVPGVSYPPTLVTTADTDDRVVPMHAKKFVAALQAADGGQNPILLRVETKAGHGKGKPTSKSIEEMTDVYAFIVKSLGMQIP